MFDNCEIPPSAVLPPPSISLVRNLHSNKLLSSYNPPNSQNSKKKRSFAIRPPPRIWRIQSRRCREPKRRRERTDSAVFSRLLICDGGGGDGDCAAIPNQRHESSNNYSYTSVPPSIRRRPAQWKWPNARAVAKRNVYGTLHWKS